LVSYRNVDVQSLALHQVLQECVASIPREGVLVLGWTIRIARSDDTVVILLWVHQTLYRTRQYRCTRVIRYVDGLIGSISVEERSRIT
jgi:hypothetical protein